MNRSLFSLALPSLALIASAAFAVSANAQSALSVSGTSPKARAALHPNPLGPRLGGNGTVAEAVARVQIEKDGYTGVRHLMRTSNGGWQAVALSRTSTPVVVSLDGQGKVSEIR